MMIEKIKFTVIIPTRDRCDVLEWALRSVTAQTYNNLEIIVSDNFSDDNTREVVSSFHDSRIRYINTGKRVSMSENWEFALSHVSEGWVSIIGDDDALLFGVLDKVSGIIKKTSIQAIRSDVCSYRWPLATTKTSARLMVSFRKGWEKRDTDIWLEKVIKGEKTYTNLPVLYNGGFIDFKILEKIKEKTSRFFNSCIPDVYMGCAISSVLKSYVYSFEPFAVNGASKHSNGMDSFSKNKKIKDSPSEKFQNEGNFPFHIDIPMNKDGSYPQSIQAIVYESYLQTIPLREQSDFINHQYQLGLILKEASTYNRSSLKEWCLFFSDLHSLDITQAKKHSIGFLGEMDILFYKIIKYLNSFVFSSDKLIINNSYDAIIAVSIINHVKPNIVKRIMFLFKTVKLSNMKL